MSTQPVLRWARRNREVVVAWEPINRRTLAGLQRTHHPLRTRSFAVHQTPSTTLVVHRLSRGAIDNDIGRLIADEIVGPELLSGPGAFERCFAGIVESTGPSPHACWRRFYLNTLRALEGADRGSATDGSIPPGTDTPISTFRQIYRHAAALLRGATVLDVGSCFAFFPMLLAAYGKRRVTASDLDPPTVALGRRIAGELRLGLDFQVADVTQPLPFAAGSFDTVTALHLLEHLPAECSATVIASLCGAARRRVIVAVPLESVPDPVYGHRQAFDLDRLAALAADVPGWRGAAHECRGGWLVLEPDRTDGASPWLVEASVPRAGDGHGRPRRGAAAIRDSELPRAEPGRPCAHRIGK
ncbi:MAG: mycofactocin oligosaccharide methyltransferase MftM [Solirubrobacteraceae bacterium]